MTARHVATIVLLAVCLVVAARAQQVLPSEPATLTIWNRPIVTFRATVGGATPEQRVNNSRERMTTYAGGPRAPPVGTRSVTIGDISGIVVTVGNNIAFGLVPADIDPESLVTLEQAASQAANRLREVLAAREQQRRLPLLARGIGFALAALLIFAAAIRLILVGREIAMRKLDSLLRKRQWAIGGIDIVPTFATVERATFRVLSWAAIGGLTYLVLTFVLRQFPYTAPLGQRLGHYLAERLSNGSAAVIAAIPHVLAIAATLLITRAVALWVSRLLAEVEHGARVVTWLAQDQARATRRIAAGMVWIIGLAITYSLLPWSNDPVFRSMSLVLGLGASLASAGLVNQWISGVVILYSRPFRIDDHVRVGDVEGLVSEIGALATKIRTIRLEEITIPNAVVTSEKLTNFTRLGGEQGVMLTVSLAIGYDVAWQHVKALLLQAAADTPGVRREPGPRVLQWELTDFYVQYQLYVRLERAMERAAVRSELNTRILDAFAAAGVQIMTPHFESQPDKPVIAAPVQLAR